MSVSAVEHHAWGLYTRQMWLDDQWTEGWWQVVQWLAPHADNDGYAGFFREENEEQPTLLLIRGGKPYVCESGKQPQLLLP